MSQHYNTKVIQIADHKQRLTQKLIQDVAEVADEIAEMMPEGAQASVKDVGILEVISVTSSIGTAKFLSIQVENNESFIVEHHIFVDENPGSSFYFHDDVDCEVTVADRNHYLSFANHIPEILEAFNL